VRVKAQREYKNGKYENIPARKTAGIAKDLLTQHFAHFLCLAIN